MRTSCRTALTAALVAAILGVPAGGGHGVAASAEDLEQLQAALTAATGRTVELGAALEQQAARDGGLRVALERLEQQHEAAQACLDARVRAVWISRRPDPLSGWVQGASAPALRHLASRGAAASVSVDRELIDAVADQSDAEQTWLAAAQNRLTTVRSTLDSASATVTSALTPAGHHRDPCSCAPLPVSPAVPPAQPLFHVAPTCPAADPRGLRGGSGREIYLNVSVDHRVGGRAPGRPLPAPEA